MTQNLSPQYNAKLAHELYQTPALIPNLISISQMSTKMDVYQRKYLF